MFVGVFDGVPVPEAVDVIVLVSVIAAVRDPVLVGVMPEVTVPVPVPVRVAVLVCVPDRVP